jgi:hypothetical protein
MPHLEYAPLYSYQTHFRSDRLSVILALSHRTYCINYDELQRHVLHHITYSLCLRPPLSSAGKNKCCRDFTATDFVSF